MPHTHSARHASRERAMSRRVRRHVLMPRHHRHNMLREDVSVHCMCPMTPSVQSTNLAHMLIRPPHIRSDPSSRCPPTPPTPEICSDGCLVAKMPRPSLAQHAPPPIMRRLPHPPATISLHSFQTSISAPPAPEIAHRRTSTTNHCSWQQPPTSRPRALVPLRQGERLGLALGECLLDESLHGR